MSELRLQKKYSKKIREALSRDQLILFVGAGVSKNSGFPNWNDVVYALKQELRGDLNYINDATKIAELYELQFSRTRLEEKIQELFPLNPPPSEIHELIIKIKPKYIITTNQDTLLEQTIGSLGVFYDVIANDEELVRSTLPNKIIKMHGDFTHNNIVFTENDYINYSHNFPLIENTLKSLLCTHTVVFLGYSYNDSTLKQINSWISHNSKVRLPMYMVIHKKDYRDLEEKYLKKQRITSIVIGDENIEDYSDALKHFLGGVGNDIKFPTQPIDNNTLFYDSILEKLSILDQLNKVYYKLILDSFSNTGLYYDKDDNAYLHLYYNEASYDQNMYIRKEYRKFIKTINKSPNKKFQLIDPLVSSSVIILNKADIFGFCSPSKTGMNITPLASKSKEHLMPCVDFDYEELGLSDDILQQKFHQLFNSYNLGNYQKSMELSKDIITLAHQNKQYIWAFIAMFNYNIVQKKFNYNIIREKVDKKEILNVEKPYDLEEIIQEYPKPIRKNFIDILKFLDFKYLWSEIYSMSQSLEQIRRNRSSIESGAHIFSSGGSPYPYKHKNLINFVHHNYILIEEFSEYKLLNKMFLDISLNRQFQEKSSSYTNIELYACIKYLDLDDLKLLFNEFTIEDAIKRRIFKFQEKQNEWFLKTIWKNLEKNYSIEGKHSLFDKYIINYLYIASFIYLTADELREIISNIVDFVCNKLCTYQFFDAINLFIAMRYGIYNQYLPDDSESKIIDTILEKIIYMRNNFLEYKAFEDNRISNVYASMNEKSVKYTNVRYVEKFISLLEEQDIKDQLIPATKVMFSLYEISNKTVKKVIKEYWLELSKKTIEDTEWYFELYCELLLRLEYIKITQLNEIQWGKLKKYYSNQLKRGIFSFRTNAIYQLCKLLYDKYGDKHCSYIKDTTDILEKIFNMSSQYDFKSDI